METERVKISQLQVNEQNPRTCTDKQFEKLVRSVITFPKMLEVRPIVVGEGGVALGGNMRLRALQAIATMTDEEIMRHIEQSAKYNGRPDVERVALLRYWQKWQHDPMVSVARTDNMTEDERREFVIKDNVGFGAWDWDMLANDWDTDELEDWGLSAWVEQPTDDKEGGKEDEGGENYSRKITTPIYEPSGEDVPLNECYDTTKADELIAKINASQVDDTVKDFLKVAAYRHVKFNYERIADYYANASKDVQELIEDSALVIIDFNKAIEDGFVNISQDLLDQYGRENGNGEERIS